MRIAISNIAWDVSEDRDVVSLLRRYDVDAIDIAPGKYFPDPSRVELANIQRVRDWWNALGIEITGMQALLFGTTGMNLFGSDSTQTRMLNHLNAVCRIGSGLGATRLVFGSPKNRDRTGLSDDEAVEIAVHFFRRLGDIAASHGVTVCLEPNPPRYGANFMTLSAETARVVSAVDHSAIRMQLDTGAMTINGESTEQVIREYALLIGHIHASEPDLVSLGDGPTDHAITGTLLKAALPNHVVSIEMLAAKDESHLSAIERALQVAIQNYRSDADREGITA